MITENYDEKQEDQIKILNEFVEKIDCLDELDKYINDVNFFEITGMVRREIKHSNFLAWVCDANGSHNIGSGFIRKFMVSAVKANPDLFNEADIVKFSVLDYSDFLVYRELDHLDIFMISDSQKVTITIENKIDAAERKEQTKDYYKHVNNKYKDYRNLFIFLTIDGNQPDDEEHWCVVDYSQVVNALEYALKRVDIIKPEVEFIINDYITMVRRRILMNDEVQDLCYKIYKSHKKAFDLIYENLPNQVSYARECIVEKLKKASISNKYDINLSDRFTKKIIRFTTKNSLKLFPDKKNNSGEWRESFSFMYEIYPTANGELLLEGVISDNNDEYAKKVLELSKEKGYVDKKSKASDYPRSWKYTIMTKPLSACLIDEIEKTISDKLIEALDKMAEYENEVFNEIYQKSIASANQTGC